MQKKLILSLIVGSIISVLALYLSLRYVPLIELAAYFKGVDYLWMGPAILAVVVSFVLRVWRWQLIVGHFARIDFRNAFHPLMIGFMINCVLPGRVGEAARPAILKKETGIPFSTGLATVAAERVFDMLILVTGFVAVLALVEIDPAFKVQFGELTLNRDLLEKVAVGTSRLGVLLLAGIVLISVNRSRQWINAVIAGLAGRISFGPPKLRRWIDRCTNLLICLNENVAAGFGLLKSPRRLLCCLFLSIAVWGVQVGSYYLVGRGCPQVSLSYGQWFAVIVMICFFIALPSVPGYWGLWEAGGIFAMRLFGISAEAAAGATLLNHALQVLPVMVVGLVSALITSVNIVQVAYEKDREAASEA
jgi:glycosyltransferase 2 family protein